MPLNSTTPISLRILITGASTGIGRASAALLAARGHHVVATARDVSSIEDLDVAATLPLDVTDDESVRSAVEAAGDVDVLVNNAGRGMRSPVEMADPDLLRELWEVNVLGPVRTMQAVLPAMRARRSGRIVNVSSVAGRRAMPLTGHYAGTKHALEAISEALRLEVAAWGVEVALVEPGAVVSEFGINRLEPRGGLGPYEGLAGRAAQWAAKANAPAQTADEVARIVAEAVETPSPPLRWPSSAAAATMMDDRLQRTDAEYEAWVLAGLAGESA